MKDLLIKSETHMRNTAVTESSAAAANVPRAFNEWIFSLREKLSRVAFAIARYLSPPANEKESAGGVISHFDVTEQKQAEQRVIKSEANLRAILNNTVAGFLLIDTAFNIVIFNKVASRQAMAERGKMVKEGMSFLEFLQVEELAQKHALLKGVLEGNQVSYELKGNGISGSQKWYTINMQRIVKEDGVPIGISICIVDITERKEAEQRISNSEALYRSLFNKSPLPVWVCERKTLRYLEVNDKAVDLYGYSREEFLQMSPFDLRKLEDQVDLERYLQKPRSGEYRRGLVKHYRKNGEAVSVDVIIHPIKYKDIDACLVIAHDVSETQKLQHELMQVQVNKQIEITKATLGGQEKERAEIGKELHDNVNQMLATAKLYLDFGLQNPGEEAGCIEKSINTIDDCIDEVRRLSKSLMPPSLGDMGLREAITELLGGIELLKGISVVQELSTLNELVLSNELKISIFRIIQEQLNNIIKYADASRVELRMEQQHNLLFLHLSDNGNGFDPSVKSKGIGFSNIINRAETYNGIVSIISSPGHGCTLEVRFRLKDLLRQGATEIDNLPRQGATEIDNLPRQGGTEIDNLLRQ